MKIGFLDRPRMKPMIMLATILVFVLFISFLSQNLWLGTAIHGAEGTRNYRETQWVLNDPDGILSGPVKFRDFLPFKSGKLYSMSVQLTYDGNQDEIPFAFLHLDHRFCRVILDGELIFSYMPEDVRRLDRSRSPGFVYHSFPLPKDCKGKQLTIEFMPILNREISYEIPEVVFGDYRCMTREMFEKDLPHNIVMILCMAMGVSALLFSAASLTGSDYRQGFNIGGFALLVSLYFMTECRTNYYYISNPYYLYFVNFTVFSLMPVSFMGVMRECMHGIRKRICTVVIFLEMMFFIAEMFLHLWGIMDMREVLPLLHLIGFAEMLIMTVLFMTLKDRKQKLTLQLQSTPVLIGMAADAIIYWGHLDIGFNDATFTTVGVLVFLFAQMATKMVTHARGFSKMQQRTIEGMAAIIEGRDGSTGAHVRNTGVYARMIAEEMYRRRMYPKEIDSEFVDRIGRLAPLHDVGKIEISDTILNKPGRFTREEYEIMKTHAALGGEIIQKIMGKNQEPEVLQMAIDLASCHHERWDGTGYPEGKKGTEIPLCARIMAAADVFDALSSERVYKPPMDIDEVFREMTVNADKQFQKEIVDVVISLRPQLEEYLKKNRAKKN